MKVAYMQLYERLSAEESFLNSAHFVAMQGERYTQNKKRFMLIGRAPNGWSAFQDIHGEVDFGERAQKEFASTDRFTYRKDSATGEDCGWIEDKSGALYSKHCEGYCLSKKPFWSYAKAIWERISEAAPDDGVWMENIVWSNLYKVSPKNEGNPDADMMKKQLDACKAILIKELETYQPTHIVIMTGYDWFEPFESVFQNPQKGKQKNILRGKNRNHVFVEGRAEYKGAKVVIACRPEYRNKDGYVEQVVTCFDEKLF